MTEYCDKCGGPLLSDGVEQDGQTVHAVCSVTDNGDPDMNRDSLRERKHKRDVAAYAREKYGSVENAPDWMTRQLGERFA